MMTSQWEYPCAPWVCHPWVLCAVCLNQWCCPSHSQSQLTVTLTLQPRGTQQGTASFGFSNQELLICFFLFLISLNVHITETVLFVVLFCFFPIFLFCMNRCSKEFHCQVGHQELSGPCMEVFWKQVSIQMHGELNVQLHFSQSISMREISFLCIL